MAEGTTTKKLHVADVVRHGEKIIIPESIDYAGAIDILRRKQEQEEEVVAVSETILAAPFDGALAFRRVLERRLGAALTTKTPGFWGPNPPVEISVPTGVGTTEMVPWGRFLLPGVKAGKEGKDWLETSYDFHDSGMVYFRLAGQVRRKFVPLVRALADDVRAEVAKHSIYRGKAFRVSFYDDEGDRRSVPAVEFLDTTQVNLWQLVYSDSVQAAIETNIFTPIRHSAQARALGVPAKRGILLSGKYGTGKTLTAYATARVAEESGWTFVYITAAKELPDAIRFAKHYGPAVIFAEDIDRTTAGGRTEQLDEILNTIDGIDSKGQDVMVVLTTNHLGTINEAMLRPGRLDAVIEVLPPDQAAVERLIRVYAHAMLTPETDVSGVARELAGQIPAVIREVVERAKLYWLTRTNGNGALELAAEDIHYAATTVLAQRALTERPSVEKKTAIGLFAEGLGTSLANYLGLPGHSPEANVDVAHHLATRSSASRKTMGPAVAALAEHGIELVPAER